MVENPDFLYFNHIKDACCRIEKYLKDTNKENFENNELLQDGVIRQLEIIGEAARHISTESRKRYGEINWKDIIGMRDKLIHDYTGIDLDIVWKTATKFVPELKVEIGKII